jgi:hypothetical protein
MYSLPEDHVQSGVFSKRSNRNLILRAIRAQGCVFARSSRNKLLREGYTNKLRRFGPRDQ